MTEPAKQPEAPDVSKAQAKQALTEVLAKLAHIEKTTGRSGAVPRTPKQRMYNIDALKAANPDKHYRYVSVEDAEKAQARLDDGYKPVPEAEAEKHGARTDIGNTRLMELPREKAEERMKELDELTRSRLKANKREVREAVEAVARELRDRHGISIPIDRLLVDED